MDEKFLENIQWDNEAGEILVIGAPMAFMSGYSFTQLQKEAEKITGEDAPIMFYEAGKSTGFRWAEEYKQKFGLENEALVKTLETFFLHIGWGKFSAESTNDGAILRVENSFIAKNYGSSSEPICHFIRGYSAGLWKGFLSKEMDSEEVKCLAMGDSHCEFVIQPMVENF